jgi:chromosome segregation ATPase
MAGEALTIEEELKELEIQLNRLRLEYEQFFRGGMKREPLSLRGKVQKTITRFMSDPPRTATHKFRFNALNARYQTYRNLWGRTMRELESGTHRTQRFRDRLHESEREEQMRAAAAAEAESTREAAKRAPAAAPAQPRADAPAARAANPLDRLHEALVQARRQTGESTDLSRDKIAELVRKQTEAIRAKCGPDAKVKFRIVVEDNKAKLKASVS